MTSSVVTITAFCAAALAAGGLLSVLSDLLLRDRKKLSQRLAEELGDLTTDAGPKSQVFPELGRMSREAGRVEPSLWTRIDDVVKQSALPVSVQQIAIASAIACFAGAVGLFLPFRSLLLAAAGGLLLLPLPLVVVACVRHRRITKLCHQLPEAFEMMTRCVRAGQTVPGAMQIAAQDLEPPLSQEFARCCYQQSLGLPFDVVLRDLARRSGVVELQMFVVTFLVQRQTGGNPVEVLDNLSDMVRKRIKMRAKVKAATGEGRMQAVVLLLLPLAMFGLMLLANYNYTRVLLDRPLLLGGVLALQIMGAAWIQKIIRFEY